MGAVFEEERENGVEDLRDRFRFSICSRSAFSSRSRRTEERRKTQIPRHAASASHFHFRSLSFFPSNPCETPKFPPRSLRIMELTTGSSNFPFLAVDLPLKIGNPLRHLEPFLLGVLYVRRTDFRALKRYEEEAVRQGSDHEEKDGEAGGEREAGEDGQERTVFRSFCSACTFARCSAPI